MKRTLSLLFVFVALAISLCACGKDDEHEKMVEEYRAAKMSAYTLENNTTDDYEIDVAFLGDSLTDMYDLESYYPQYKVSNRGIGGDTTFDLEKRLKTSVYDLKPKAVVMLIGANNPRNMFDNYEKILIGLKENLPNTKIIILSLTSMGGEWGKNNELTAYNNVKIKLLCEKYSFEYVDLYSPLFNLEDGEVYDEYVIDGGHLTPKGYEVLTENITPAIEKQLAIWHLENQSK